MSPLEYSAMLKLQGTQNDPLARTNPKKPKPKMGLQRRVSDGKEYKSVSNGGGLVEDPVSEGKVF